MHALTQAPRPRAGGGRRLPAASRGRPEDGGAHLDAARHHDRSTASRAPPRRGGCAISPGLGARSEEKILKALEAGVGDKRGGAPASRSGASCGTPGRRRARRASGGDRGLGGGQRPAAPRDRPRPRPHRDVDRPAGADRRVLRRGLGRRGRRRAATRRRPSSVTTASASTSGWFRPSATATCSSTSRARRTTTSRCARTLSAVGSRSRSTGSRTVETRRGRDARERGRAVRVPRLRAHPARAAGGNARDRRPRARASCRRSSSSATCAARCTATRPGRRTARTRSRRWRSRPSPAATASSASPTTRTTSATGGSRRQWKEIAELNERLKSFRVLRGIEVNIRADGSLDVDDEVARRARLGDRVAAHVVRPQPDRADPRRDGQPARRLHRAPHRSTAAQARRSAGGRRTCRRARGRDRDGARDQLPARSSRHARHARAARRRGRRARSRSRPTRTRSARSGTRSSASRRRGARGSRRSRC